MPFALASLPCRAIVLLFVPLAVLAACTIETEEPVFSRDDVVRVDEVTAKKMGFMPVEGGETYFYQDEERNSCAEVGFVPLDDEHRLYIATNFAHPCMKEESRYFYMLADFGAGTLRPFAQEEKDRKPVRQLADDFHIRLLYDDREYRYVAVGDVPKENLKAFFLALAETEYAVKPEE